VGSAAVRAGRGLNAHADAAATLAERVERLRRDQPEAALRVIERDFARALRRADPLARGRLWRLRAHVLRSVRRNGPALDAYRRADAWFQRGRNPFERGRTTIGWTDSLMYLGRYAEARRVAARGRRWLERSDDRAALARLLNNEANLHHRLDRPDLALPLYRRARQALARAGEPRMAVLVDGNVANCLSLVGRCGEARRLYRRAEHSHARAGAHVDALRARYLLAYLDYLELRHERALEGLEAVRREAEGRGVPSLVALAALDRAEIFLRLNDASAAHREAETAAGQCRALGLEYERAKADLFAALAEHRMGRPASAERRLQQTLAAFHGEGNDVWAGEALIGLATLWWREGNPHAAQALLASAVRLFAGARDVERECCARALLARVRIACGRTAAARSELARLDARADARAGWRMRHLVWGARAEMALRRGDRAAARRWLERAARASERLAARILDEQWRASFWGEWGWPHEKLAVLELEEGRIADAIEALERGRGRGLLGRGRSRLSPAVRAWAASGRARDRERNSRAAAPADFVAAPLRIEPGLRRTLEHPRAARVSVAAIRRRMPAGSLLVDYFMHDGVLDAFRVTPAAVDARRGLVTAERLGGLVEAALFSLRSAAWREPGDERVDPALDEVLAGIAAAVLWPVLAAPPSGAPRRLTIVPSAPLARLPWAALPLPDGRRLCEAMEISVVPGLRLGLAAHGARAASGAPLIVSSAGDDLDHVVEECDALARRFPDAVRLAGAEATAARFLELAPGAAWIHFAGHGLFRADRPQHSGMQFADRWLHAEELRDVRLGARWITLSACQTARALVQPGEEWFGLGRALMLGGARSIVAAQWDVADAAAARLMTGLYDRLGRGAPLGRALADTQCAQMRSGAHPWDWAGFVLLNGPGASARSDDFGAARPAQEDV